MITFLNIIIIKITIDRIPFFLSALSHEFTMVYFYYHGLYKYDVIKYILYINNTPNFIMNVDEGTCLHPQSGSIFCGIWNDKSHLLRTRARRARYKSDWVTVQTWAGLFELG